MSEEITNDDASVADATETPTSSVASGLDIGSQADTAAAVAAEPINLRGKLMADGTVVATGRRKTAVARVRMKTKGAGKIVINDYAFEEFFPVEQDRIRIMAPLRDAAMVGQVDLFIRTSGGGVSGQAGAILLGLARALQTFKPELHQMFGDAGYLTRDDRMVERKKYGHKKARRSFQFSKR
jgi:small subunit ribosomal protein S9